MFAKIFAVAIMALAASAVTIPSEKRSVDPSGTHSGDGKSTASTYYETGLGACGITNSDTDYIAAVSHTLFDNFPGYGGGNSNSNPICGKSATANYDGKSVSFTITDRCVGCAEWDLDFSPTAFSQLANEDVGRIYGVTWSLD
ncbi:uncharacterized protein PHACADRAFT_97638 [Phanerochaete carnosa HHB-10118-sp]|uniref:Uncharacterized protein n=1 Tax=Phanerochaete carnosa (strain HHB-10118-sp) TaxID=650164 RepID=K5VRW4_PHACS|nr:uncharacterized protein PHACADRAFT_97638 [Phanerochaete carnosa HHB-10118-sp]EKM54243.1 hypothetical protein PHACADRAFT_97638 [Phanerochaete carnosa HHB-10118-sp]